MKNKAKGSNAERELLQKFWERGWTACRVAGSGSMRYPSPDIISTKNGRILAIECKSTREKYKYLKKEEIIQLMEYATISQSTPYIALRFMKEDWLFIHPEDLEEKKTSFGISMEDAKKTAKKFEEIING
jgi:Holliday junction resolvase